MKNKISYYFILLIVLNALMYFKNIVEAYSLTIISKTYLPDYKFFLLEYVLLIMIGVVLGVDHILEKRFSFSNLNKVNLTRLTILGIPNLLIIISPFYGVVFKTNIVFHNYLNLNIAAIILGYIFITSINFNKKLKTN